MKSIFITGASSGIGEHLAYFYSSKAVTLGLSARRIVGIKSRCKKM